MRLVVEIAKAPKVAAAVDDGKWQAEVEANLAAHARAAETKADRLAQWRLEHDKIAEVPKGVAEEVETAKRKRRKEAAKEADEVP